MCNLSSVDDEKLPTHLVVVDIKDEPQEKWGPGPEEWATGIKALLDAERFPWYVGSEVVESGVVVATE